MLDGFLATLQISFLSEFCMEEPRKRERADLSGILKLKRLSWTSFWVYVLVGAALIMLQAVILLAMGLPGICRCSYVALWHANPSGPETSQHLTDWYTYTHVIHGFGFYLLLWLVAPHLSFGSRLAIAIGLEVGWEIIENTPFIMERYRQSALARGYFGDSAINSVADTLAAAFGFVLARRLPLSVILGLAAAAELFAAYMIRDNLMLNIIQLIYSSGLVSRWQAG
jgi:hypothetical protein